MTLGLAQQHITMWWISIGMGFVVVLVVIVLLSLLISFVTDIDRNVKSLWGMATRLARNTATTWMLQQTASATAALADETGRHAQELTGLAATAAPPARPVADYGGRSASATATQARPTSATATQDRPAGAPSAPQARPPAPQNRPTRRY